jgi:hypothetical protein
MKKGRSRKIRSTERLQQYEGGRKVPELARDRRKRKRRSTPGKPEYGGMDVNELPKTDTMSEHAIKNSGKAASLRVNQTGRFRDRQSQQIGCSCDRLSRGVSRPNCSGVRRPSRPCGARLRDGQALNQREVWSGRGDLNARPPAPKAGALPGCATPRQLTSLILTPFLTGDARRSPEKLAMDILEHRCDGGKPIVLTQLSEAFPRTFFRKRIGSARPLDCAGCASFLRSEYALDKMGPWEPLRHR